ncbi:zinc finger protein CONSTANS-LIKE 9-like [Euphorbia lathyris]|uniref:zinc finger protein CONSTANS-LIKE 9-like n=1 Tax=Euphorbia lathyris TaxID=212925 RepID=UPI0033133EB0
MKKGCELCNGVARMYCESDQASLCWDCDEKVHCANFLVAKHCRCLLCQICQSPTAWKASGPKLGPTVSICESCFSLNQKKTEITCDLEESHAGNNQSERDDCLDGDSEDDEDEDDIDDDEDDDDEEVEEGENQVVPWSVTSPRPPMASSSSSEDISSRFFPVLKRMRANSADIDSDDEIGCSSYHIGLERISNDDEGNSIASDRPLKKARRGEEEYQEEDDDHPNDLEGQGESKSTAIIHSLKRLQTQLVMNRETASQTILGICRLSRSHSSR